LRPGDVLADRFDIVATAGAGAMGVVYRGHDRHTGQDVAVKVMHPGEDAQAARFAREARAIAAIAHPAIVRYVAHGMTEIAEPYLVMEWVDGELLSKRLGRGPLGVADAVMVTHRIAEALGAAHARRVVHRDLKPGNVVLVGGRVDQIKVIDFGLVSFGALETQLTVQGMLVGTPAYMSPEQARGSSEVDARSDVYSLGCLVYRALAGRTPSVAEDVRALLAKIALEPPPPLARLRPDVPMALDRLVAQMLSKEPEGRPADGSAVAAELAAIVVDSDAELTIELQAHSDMSRGGLTGSERVIVSVAMALPREGAASLSARVGGDLAGGGAELVPLADGALLLAMRGAGGAAEQAASAARAALRLRAQLADAPIVLATGRGMRGERVPVGEAIERAAELLRVDVAEGGPSDAPRPIRIDGVTAGLLDARFDVRDRGGSLSLVGEREGLEGTRTLLGRPTTCVGRERELGVLTGLFDESVAEPVARAVLVTAPAGVGKSRLRYEFLRQIEARGRRTRVLLGSGDPMRAGSPFGLVARAVRRWAGTRDGQPLEAQQRSLARAVEGVVRADARRVTRFLGDACGVPFRDDEDAQLRAARRDPMLMGDRVRRAWRDLVGALCDVAPVVLVLEDLHWGDLPSVQLVDTMLRDLADKPLLVLALARPEVDDAFPRLWAERDVQRLTLAPLTRRASERLVRDVLGAAVGRDTVGRIVTLGAGNAFYLEELIRAVAQGAGERLPETVLAMVEARLDTLEPEARRLLRAASVFGEVFWESGVSALLRGGSGSDDHRVDVRGWLDVLVSRELVTARGDARFPGERELGFRHALLREAAYAMLTDEDLARGHSLAGAWLEQAGETEAIALAEHFEKASERPRAAAAYARAADQAFAASDFSGTIARVDHALACGSPEASLGALHLLRAEASHWMGDAVGTVQGAMLARELLDPTHPIWWRAVGVLILGLGGMGRGDECVEWAKRLIESWPLRPDLQEAVGGACRSALALLAIGHSDLSDELTLLANDAVRRSGAALDPEIAAQLHRMSGFRAIYRGELGVFAKEFKAAAEAYDAIGDVRRACVEHANHGWALAQLGRLEEGERVMSEARETAKRIGTTKVQASLDHNIGVVYLRRRQYERARDVEQNAARTFEAHGDKRLEGTSRLYLALALVGCGDADAAEREAVRAVEVLKNVPPSLSHALAALASVRLARGDVARALECSREANVLLESLDGIEEGEEQVRLVYAEALHASGDQAGARRAIEAARNRLMLRAESIDDPEWRSSFLTGVPDNARTMELARAWY
jgi:tetratricopeptide (TPR) repeat protein